MSFYSIYAILLRIRFCRNLRYFCVNFKAQICGRVIFLTNIISVLPLEHIISPTSTPLPCVMVLIYVVVLNCALVLGCAMVLR